MDSPQPQCDNLVDPTTLRLNDRLLLSLIVAVSAQTDRLLRWSSPRIREMIRQEVNDCLVQMLATEPGRSQFLGIRKLKPYVRVLIRNTISKFQNEPKFVSFKDFDISNLVDRSRRSTGSDLAPEDIEAAVRAAMRHFSPSLQGIIEGCLQRRFFAREQGETQRPRKLQKREREVMAKFYFFFKEELI